MKKYLTFSQENSHKFWSIVVVENAFTVTCGKTGTSGQTSTKTFDDEHKCLKEAQKLINEKLKKGYVVTDETPAIKTEKAVLKVATDYKKEWHDIIDAKDIHKALYDHFLYLCDTPGFEPILKAVMDEAVSAQVKNKELVVVFRGNEVLSGGKPATKENKKFPLSYNAVLAMHSHLSLRHAQRGIGEHGLFNEDDGWFEGLEDEESELLEHGPLSKIISPMYDYSDLWLYHPVEKNPQGEPVIYYLSHEGGDIYDEQYCNIGSLFLKRFARSLSLKIELPEIKINTEDAVDYKAWWLGLDEGWKEILKNSDENIESAEDAHKVKKITSIYIDEKSAVTSLEPLQYMPKLEELNCNSQGITDISPLQHIKKLSRLELTGKQIKDFSPLKDLTRMETLELAYTSIEDISFLTLFSKLERLDLGNTRLKDISPLKGLSKLRNLDIPNTDVKDISALATLKKLSMLNISHTKVTNLKPLDKCPQIHHLVCKGLKISFKVILEFIQPKTKGVDEFMGLVDVYSDYNDTYDNEILIKSVEAIDFPVGNVLDALLIRVNNTLISIIKGKEAKTQASRLIKAYMRVLKNEKLPQSLHENLASNTLVTVVNGDLDEASVQEFLTHFIPDTIKHPVLAFNLACYYARIKDKPKLLKYAALAIENGHERERFKADKDFAAYLKDKDFVALISKSIFSDNPEANPMDWYNKIPEEVKQSVFWKEPETAKDVLEIITAKDFQIYSQGDKSLDYLTGLKHLKELRLVECKASTLDVLSTLTSLEVFECEKDQYLGGTQFTDISSLGKLSKLINIKLSGHLIKDISSISGLIQLKYLNLWNNPIVSVEALKNMVNLKALTISPSGTIDTMELKNLVNLVQFDLNMNKKCKVISLDGLAEMRNMDYLWIQNLIPAHGNTISLEPLSKMKKLRNLFLDKTPFESLKPLYGLKSLEWLSIDQKMLTDEVREDFMKNMPQCKLD